MEYSWWRRWSDITMLSSSTAGGLRKCVWQRVSTEYGIEEISFDNLYNLKRECNQFFREFRCHISEIRSKILSLLLYILCYKWKQTTEICVSYAGDTATSILRSVTKQCEKNLQTGHLWDSVKCCKEKIIDLLIGCKRSITGKTNLGLSIHPKIFLQVKESNVFHQNSSPRPFEMNLQLTDKKQRL